MVSLGATFPQIADDALIDSDLGECQCCERTDVPSYDYRGEILEPALAANPELAMSEPEIHAACDKCILSGAVKKSAHEISEVQKLIDEISRNNPNALEQYHQIPHIPLMMQREDWPHCCDAWCEYTGVPSNQQESVAVPATYQFWNRQPANPHWDFELRPESLNEVCLFQCTSCDKLFFIWQPT